MSDIIELSEAIRVLEIHMAGDTESVLFPVVDAARAYADLLENGQRVQWCEGHRASAGDKSDICDIKDGYPNATLGRCRILSKLLTEVPE